MRVGEGYAWYDTGMLHGLPPMAVTRLLYIYAYVYCNIYIYIYMYHIYCQYTYMHSQILSRAQRITTNIKNKIQQWDGGR
jgi:hypothetical protein